MCPGIADCRGRHQHPAFRHDENWLRCSVYSLFDELDEGTAIFKVRQDPPQGESLFVAEKEVPGDHYLWLTGMAGQLLRGRIKPADDALPVRKK